MRPVPAPLGVTLTWAALLTWALLTSAPLTSALPSEAFVVRSAWWQLTRGPAPQKDVLAGFSAQTECECLSRCLTRDDCLSFSHSPAEQSCALYNVRGNANSPRPDKVRYRGLLAYLGDWCETDQDCSLLTSGAATCRQKTCSCPDGQHIQDRTTCGASPSAQSTTTAASSAPSATLTTSPTTSPTTAPLTTPITVPVTASPTTPTTNPTTNPTSTSTTPTTTLTTTPTTTPTAPTTRSTAPTPLTTTPTTTPTTPTTTTQTTTPAATIAPDVRYVQKAQNGYQVNGQYLMDCTQDPSLNMVMVGLKDDPTHSSAWKDLDQANCAEYRHLGDLVIGPKGSPIRFSTDASMYSCPAGSVLVGLMDADWRYNMPDAMECAAIEGPYRVDVDDCAEVEITDPIAMRSESSDTGNWPFQCPQLPQAAGIVSLRYDLNADDFHWKAMQCCLITSL